MQGLNRHTGKTITGIEWLEQSITDILTTPKGSRTMRADYGSNLHELLDQNITPQLSTKIHVEVTSALGILKDIFQIKYTKITHPKAGDIEIDITGIYLENGQTITLEGVKIS